MSLKNLTRIARELVPNDVDTLCQVAQALDEGDFFLVVSDGNKVFGANGPGIESLVVALVGTVFAKAQKAQEEQRCS